MPNLYELSAEMQAIQNAFESGEIPEEAFADTLEGVQMERNQKIENICKLRQNLLSDAAAFEAEAERLKDRESTKKNEAERLQAYLYDALQAAGERKVKAGLFTASIVKSAPAVKINNQRIVPEGYFTQPEPVLNKAAIKDAIKAGTIVPGAELVQGEHLTIR